MFFREVINEDLACVSYVVADGGEAAIIDPKWDTEGYLDMARENGFDVAHILETHNHADHVSGKGRLAAATGARIHVPEGAEVEYPHEPLREGNEIRVGGVRIAVLATPGHRPEHVSFLVKDGSRSEEVWMLISGDFLFVGDLARPDLAVDAGEGARGIFRSLRKLEGLGDFVEVWPAHIGGSLCGGAAMSRKPSSTLGFERRHNPHLKVADEERFVENLTAGLPPQPPNFERIVELNRGPLLTEAVFPEPLLPRRVAELLRDGAVLIDGRDQREFDGAHVPGSINVTMNQSGVGTRAAWVVQPDTEIVTAAGGDDEAYRMVRMLEAVGFRRIRGYLSGGVAAWKAAGLQTRATPALDAAGLAKLLEKNEVLLLDVRSTEEWEEGHVEGSVHIPYQRLRDGIPPELRGAGKPLVVACSGGVRSSIAASLLERAGVRGIMHVAEGGIPDLEGAGVHLVRR
ncbi:MAG: MBL fold metallo-hydrolase [Rubrobacter sp.]|nr:MBL fold metallo-hydrolase [Rubrobacter sp.]